MKCIKSYLFSVKDEPFESEPNETEETKLMLKVDQNFLDPLEDSDEDQDDRNRYTLVGCRTYKKYLCVFSKIFVEPFLRSASLI